MLRVARGTREYEWYDHNSLLGDVESHQALDAALHGPRARPPGPCRDGGCARRVRGTRRRPGSLRMRVGIDAQRGRRLRARDLRRRVPLPRVRVRARDDRGLEAADPRPRRGAALRGHPVPEAIRRKKRLHRRQAELGLRGRPGPPPVGEDARAGLTAPGRHGRARVLTPSAALPAAVRRARARRLGEPRRRRLDRARRASRGWIPDPRARDDLAGRADVRGRRCDRRDRVPDAPSRPPRASALPRSTTDGSRLRRPTGRASPCRGSSSPGT